MTTASTQDISKALVFSLELGARKWLATFGARGVDRTVRREVPASDAGAIRAAMAWARARLGLPADSAAFSCHEAGRDGFHPHRLLESLGVGDIMVDPSSILVDRRRKRTKTDRIDGAMLLALLLRHLLAERREDRLSVVRIPTLQEEMNRMRDREIKGMKEEVQGLRNQVKSLEALMGVRRPARRTMAKAGEGVCWDGSPLPPELKARIDRDLERLALLQRQIKELERARVQQTRPRKASSAKPVAAVAQANAPATTPDRATEQRIRLERLKAVGASTSSILVNELFAWREFRNVRELGSFVGLAPAPWRSGTISHEQGITKAGNKLVRWALGQLAHGWLLHQPDSELSKWWRRRFGGGSAVTRKVGIVALARKLLLALWKYVKGGDAPAGAALKPS